MEIKCNKILKAELKTITEASVIRRVKRPSIEYAVKKGYLDYTKIGGNLFIVMTPKSREYLKSRRAENGTAKILNIESSSRG